MNNAEWSPIKLIDATDAGQSGLGKVSSGEI
jgi:hypothetical protein